MIFSDSNHQHVHQTLTLRKPEKKEKHSDYALDQQVKTRVRFKVKIKSTLKRRKTSSKPVLAKIGEQALMDGRHDIVMRNLNIRQAQAVAGDHLQHHVAVVEHHHGVTKVLYTEKAP